MFEVIGMITLGKLIKRIVVEKGHKPLKFIFIMISLWIGFEIIGLFVGLLLFGPTISAYLMAFPGAAIGGMISYNIAQGAPVVEPKYSNE